MRSTVQPATCVRGEGTGVGAGCAAAGSGSTRWRKAGCAGSSLRRLQAHLTFRFSLPPHACNQLFSGGQAPPPR